jgi:Domain of unknown function (DUF4180)
MADGVSVRHRVRVLVCDPDGAKLCGERDVTAVVGRAFEQHAPLVAIPVTRLDDGFFTLRTGVAGQIVQRFVMYHLRLAIVGDISRYLDRSPTLRAFVAESNRGRQVWFVADLGELDERLARSPVRAGPAW